MQKAKNQVLRSTDDVDCRGNRTEEDRGMPPPSDETANDDDDPPTPPPLLRDENVDMMRVFEEELVVVGVCR